MPYEQYLDTDGLNSFWLKAKSYIDENGGPSQAFLVRAPIGTIVIWSGTANNIPTGWQLCDGTNGTPDLRDKFVLGAGATHAVGSFGGEEEVILNVEQMPEHSHGVKYLINGKQLASGTDYNRFTNLSGNSISETSTQGGNQPHNNMPPYYALCFIMKLVADPADGVTQEELATALATKQDALVDGTGTTVEGNAVNVIVPSREITSAEYKALSEEEKNKPVVYIITDDNEESSTGQVYSTEETRIGTWVDGRPLYRKVINCDFSLSTTQTSTTIPLPSGAEPQFFHGVIGPTPWGTRYPIYFAEQNGNVMTYIFPVASEGSLIIINRWVSDTPTVAQVTVEYTKSTDQAEVK